VSCSVTTTEFVALIVVDAGGVVKAILEAELALTAMLLAEVPVQALVMPAWVESVAFK
jgi:hypothetical protein